MSATNLQTAFHLTLLLWSIMGIVAACVLVIGAIFLIRLAIQRKQAIREYERNHS